MGKKVGSEKLGSLYTMGKVRRRREWRGVRDTLYDEGGFQMASNLKPRHSQM